MRRRRILRSFAALRRLRMTGARLVRISHYGPAMPTKAAPRAAVRRALDQKQLVVFYQPIHELGSRRVVAAEALLRARRRSGEIRNAARVAAAAEKGPDVYRLDSWMIGQAFRDAAAWQSEDAAHVRLHVNVSARELDQRGLSTRLRALAKTTG